MNRIIKRLVATFLVLGLIADPALAVSISTHQTLQSANQLANFHYRDFQAQALSAEEIFIQPAIDVLGNRNLHRREVARQVANRKAPAATIMLPNPAAFLGWGRGHVAMTPNPHDSLSIPQGTQDVTEHHVDQLWALYRAGDSPRFRAALRSAGLDPDVVIKNMKGYTESYLREKVAHTIFTERFPRSSEKRVFQSDAVDFHVGFAYNILDGSPDQTLPESFAIAYERGGSLVGRIFYLQNVTLTYQDRSGQQQHIVVPYLLVQESLTEYGTRMKSVSDWPNQDSAAAIDLQNQFLEIHREMYRRGFSNVDMKIAVNYGVTKDDRVVLLDTGGIRKEIIRPNISWYVSLPHGVRPPDYEREIGAEPMRVLWETGVDNIARSTFVNADLEPSLRRILMEAIASSTQEAGDPPPPPSHADQDGGIIAPEIPVAEALADDRVVSLSKGLIRLKSMVAEKLKAHPDRPVVILLEGQMGAGKTTLSRQLKGKDERVTFLSYDEGMEKCMSQFESAIHDSKMRVVIIEGYFASSIIQDGIQPDLRVMLELEEEVRLNRLKRRVSQYMGSMTPVEHLYLLSVLKPRTPLEQFDLILQVDPHDLLPLSQSYSLLDSPAPAKPNLLRFNDTSPKMRRGDREGDDLPLPPATPKPLAHKIVRVTVPERTRPRGSLVTYLITDSEGRIEPDTMRDEIVAAQNRWQVAKGCIPVTREDIVSLEVNPKGSRNVHVQWSIDLSGEVRAMQDISHGNRDDMIAAIRRHPSATQDNFPTKVFINGAYAGDLTPSSLQGIVHTLETVQSQKLLMREDAGRRLIDIRYYFRGRIIGEELFEHLMDNLHGIENPKLIDQHTIIGTAILPDWIMGGTSTQRIWVQDKDGAIIALRPQYNDDIKTSDRRLEYKEGASSDDDRRIAAIRQAVAGIREIIAASSRPRGPADNTEPESRLGAKRRLQNRPEKQEVVGDPSLPVAGEPSADWKKAELEWQRLLSRFPDSLPVEEMRNAVWKDPEWLRLRDQMLQICPALAQLFPQLTSAIGPMFERRSPLMDIERDAARLVNDPEALQVIDGQKFQFVNKRLPAWAALASPEVLQSQKDFAKKQNGLDVLTDKRSGQAIAIFLAARKTREAARAFLAGFEPQAVNESILRDEGGSVSAFWYYLPIVYEKLREAGDSFEQAGRRLAYWAYHFDEIENQVPLKTTFEHQWRDWLDENQSKLDDYIDQDKAVAIANVLRSISDAAPADELDFELGPILKRGTSQASTAGIPEDAFELHAVRRKRSEPAQDLKGLDFTLHVSKRSKAGSETKAVQLNFPEQPVRSYVTPSGIRVTIRQSPDENVPNLISLTARSGNVQIGSALLDLNIPGVIWLGWIGIEDRFKEEGHGKQLMTAIVEEARQLGKTRIDCQIARSSTKAHAFFAEVSNRLGLKMKVTGHDDVFDHIQLEVPVPAPAVTSVMVPVNAIIETVVATLEATSGVTAHAIAEAPEQLLADNPEARFNAAHLVIAMDFFAAILSEAIHGRSLPAELFAKFHDLIGDVLGKEIDQANKAGAEAKYAEFPSPHTLSEEYKKAVKKAQEVLRQVQNAEQLFVMVAHPILPSWQGSFLLMALTMLIAHDQRHAGALSQIRNSGKADGRFSSIKNHLDESA